MANFSLYLALYVSFYSYQTISCAQNGPSHSLSLKSFSLKTVHSLPLTTNIETVVTEIKRLITMKGNRRHMSHTPCHRCVRLFLIPEVKASAK